MFSWIIILLILSFFGKQPEISTLRVFGIAIFPYTRPYNIHKLQPHTIQCVFLGCAPGYKGVFCYDHLHDKCFLSWHVIHDEQVFPFKKNHDHDNFKLGNSSTSGVLIVSVVMTLPSSSVPQFNDAYSSQSSGSAIRTPSLNHVFASSFHQDSLPVLTNEQF